ncbi:MAG: NUDIX hydrolase [Theionarchaea archaeon]|nr:NUDIX hydrolase [Theionarchaea archaeon]
MKREYPERPITGVGVIIYNEGKVLIIKRAFEPSKNRWSIPGGAVELGEKVRDAAKREVYEELGLDVEIKDVVDVLDNIVYGGEKIKYHFVLVDFWAELRGGDLILSPECLDAAWVDKDELDLYDLTRGARTAIEKVFRIVKNVKCKEP